MFSMVFDILIFIFVAGFLPVLINKTTEGYRLDWIQEHIRPLWMLVFTIFTIYFLHRLEVMEVLMNYIKKWPPAIQYVIIGTIGAIIFCTYWWFTGIVFKKSLSTLNIDATGNIQGYPANTPIGGLIWNKDCSAIRLYLHNETDRDYKDLDISINIPGISIWAMGQITNIPNVSFIPATGPIIVGQGFVTTVNPKTGEKHEIPTIPIPALSSTSEYRVRCPVFPRYTHMDLIIEVSVKKPNSSFFGEKALPKMIQIDAHYQDLGRDHSYEIKLYLQEDRKSYHPKLD